jgi:hypothetical protein
MRIMVLLFSLCLISGCSSDKSAVKKVDEIDLTDIDLTGTWEFITETRTTKISTGEYLQSDFYTGTMLFDDNENGVQFNECHDYGGAASYGIKTKKNLYLHIWDDGYKLLKGGRLQKISHSENEYQPGFSFETITTLSKISEEILLDSGALILNGAVSVEEYSHVCLSQYYSNIGVSKSLELFARYGDSYLSFRLDMMDEISAGQYQYEYRYNGSHKPLLLDVYSGASEFDAVVNSNTLSPRDVTINVFEISEERLMGSFDFIGQDDSSYSGEFEVVY